jgi:predicted nucleic acid-binding Zn ribbon protein
VSADRRAAGARPGPDDDLRSTVDPLTDPSTVEEAEPASAAADLARAGRRGLDVARSAVEEAEPASPVDDHTGAGRAGPDLARSALEAARLASRRRAADQPASRRVAGRRGAGPARRGGYSGAGPDARDPQRFGTLIHRLLADRGWEATAASATVLAGWDRLVGAEVAAHCQPVNLRDGELTLAAESTAWATQLRLLAPKLLGLIRAELGPDVVRRVRVHGPTAPTWGAGPRRVAGRGPRDTYG